MLSTIRINRIIRIGRRPRAISVRAARRLLVGALAASVLGAAACGGDSTGPNGDRDHGVAGTYGLQQWNGERIPVLWNGREVLTDGSLTLRDDGTWTMTINSTKAGDPAEPLLDNGAYQRESEHLTLHSESFGDSFYGEAGDGEVVLSYDLDGSGDYESELTFTK
jgi:hypothetical protein